MQMHTDQTSLSELFDPSGIQRASPRSTLLFSHPIPQAQLACQMGSENGIPRALNTPAIPLLPRPPHPPGQ
jgi:hypothetical protein